MTEEPNEPGQQEYYQQGAHNNGHGFKQVMKGWFSGGLPEDELCFRAPVQFASFVVEVGIVSQDPVF